MKLKKFFKNQYVYSVIMKLIMVIIGFLNSMVLARYLGPDLKGLSVSIVNYANIFGIIITFGIHEAYPFFRKKNNSATFLSEYMSFTIVLYSVYVCIACVVGLIFNNDVEVIMYLIVTLFHGYSTIVNYVAVVEHPNKRNTALTAINILDVAILIFFYLFIPSNLPIACFVTAFIYIAESVYFTYFIKFKFDIKHVNLGLAKKLLSFGFFPMVALLLTTLNYRVDIVMLRMYPEISYAAIGIYSIGVSLAEKVFLIPNAVKEILLSKLARGKDAEEVKKVIKVCWPICLCATVAIVLLGQQFIDIFYGAAYSTAYDITIVCMIGTVFMVFFKMISTYNIVHGKQKINVILLSVAVVLNIILNSLLIPKYEIMGAAIASDISYFVCACLFVIYFCKTQKVKIHNLIIPTRDDFNSIKSVFNKG